MPLYTSLIPRRNLWDEINFPSDTWLNGLWENGFDDLPLSTLSRYPLLPRTVILSDRSEVKNQKDKFQVMLNVKHFKPKEVEVKVVDNYIVIHGKHEEKPDEHGLIQREFTRRYLIPEGTEADRITTSWSLNGVLTIEAPKKAIESPPKNERVVPIIIQRRRQDAEENK